MSSPRQEERPRSRTMLSFTSNHSTKSHRSSGSIGKIDLTETSKDKRHLNTKADPTLAINEAQPSAVALELSSLDNLRGMQHKDIHGNLISDPDRSNPTRHRMERPLDTIRSFEAAVDGSYKRRATSYQQRPSSGQGLNGPFDNRRGSAGFYGHTPQSNQSRGYQEGGYYGGRNSMNRPDSFIDAYSGQSPSTPTPGGRGPRMNPRMNSEPMYYGARNHQNIYPSHSYQQSYDTVHSAGSGSYQTDPYGNSTDPSSENSSLDRIHQFAKQPEPQSSDNYGNMGYGGSQYQNDTFSNGQSSYGRNGQAQYPTPGQQRFDGFDRPMPPPKEAPRAPIKLDGRTGGSPLTRQISDAPTEKRKSWFKRRFSKN